MQFYSFSFKITPSTFDINKQKSLKDIDKIEESKQTKQTFYDQFKQWLNAQLNLSLN